MKISFAALASLLGSAHAIASPSTISKSDFPRFLQEKTTLEQELRAWKESAAGQLAKQHDFFITASKTNVQSADEMHEDQVRRFFLTKLHIEQAQQANPDAVFSTDSPFTLMTDEEFAAFVGNSFKRGDSGSVLLGQGLAMELPGDQVDASDVNGTIPDAGDKDWTTSGCVAPVKNQGQCGSCWAFAAVASLESAYCLKGNPLTLLSDQQVVSCDSESGGCEGGFPGDALNYVQQNRGICLAEAYPYVSGTSRETEECETASCTVQAIEIQQVVNVPRSESGLVTALGGRPVAVGVAAGNNTWKQYKRGVVSSCSSSQLDHAVLAVGYGGSSTSTPFFKIKNSWGTTWGEAGYIRLKRGVSGAGTCGIIGPKSVYPVL
uniref:Peptidase C1A papain C-terminal domain-containing protein n=1 Tax=Globisporangium ultimum (strain ATCC 200006 / CBS 805.95 / DAOM BR144) TaxID=431595 RepID=K3WB02_GLOUD